MYRQQRLEAFSSNLCFLVSVNIAISTLLVFSGIYSDIGTDKLAWLMGIYLACILRLSVHFFVPNSNPYKLDFHFMGVLLAAVAWASFPYLFHDEFGLREKAITIIIFCGMSGGSATLLSSDIRSAIAFTAITVFPFSLVLINSDSYDERVIGVMSIGYGVALCLSSLRSRKFIMSSIRDRFKVDSLVKSLEHEVESRTEKITLLEQKDSVTGLLNRTSFLATVKSLQEAHPCEDPECRCAMIYIHLSKFQLLCSNYGHGYGDYVLNVIGKRLLNIDERYNTIASKWNGSGFILYFPHGSNVSIARFIENINHLLSREIQYLSLITTPSFHYGFYELGCEMTLSNAVNNAYLSMLEGKKKNIKIYSFDQGLKDKLQWQEELLAKMTTAINADDFYMVYQPIVDVTTDNVSGFEALIRWELDGKFVSPDDFIPIAEQHGLIFSIGKLVLRSSMQTLHEINQHLPHISMSINVSVIQFEDEHFLDHLRKLLSEYDVRVENIHLEVTETAMIRDLEKLSYVISEIKKMGVRISIDDFGTGFSSIAVLKSLNVDYIKIDKTYIDDICHDEKDRSIVSALTKMSHAIDVKVIAEGVEDESQKTLLSDYDVDFYQGYLFSKPMQKDDALTLLGIKSDDASAVVNSGW